MRVYCFIIFTYRHIDTQTHYMYIYIYICVCVYIYIYIYTLYIHTYDICYCVFIVRGHVLECLNAKTREFGNLETNNRKKTTTEEPNIQFFGGTQPWVEHRFCPKDGTRKDDQRNGCFAGGIGFFLGPRDLPSRSTCQVFLISMRTEGSASESFLKFLNPKSAISRDLGRTLGR